MDKPILLLGRHPECDIQIESRKISRRHCCIAQVNDYLVVRDLDSTNGIRINGVRVVEGKLETGDEVTIGNQRYRVTWTEEDGVKAKVRQPMTSKSMSVEDQMLEECDDPVPLPDPARSQAKPVKPPKPTVAMQEDSLHIPDDLELLPGSGSFPGPK